METLIGEVDIKSSKVMFSSGIQNIVDYEVTGETIMYDHSPLSIGMWGNSNQKFSAPYPGTYFFFISGSFGSTTDPTSIHFKVNEYVYGRITGSKNSPSGTFSYQIAMQLNVGDKVYLFLERGAIFMLSFTGWMVDETLENI